MRNTTSINTLNTANTSFTTLISRSGLLINSKKNCRNENTPPVKSSITFAMLQPAVDFLFQFQ